MTDLRRNWPRTVPALTGRGLSRENVETPGPACKGGVMWRLVPTPVLVLTIPEASRKVSDAGTHEYVRHIAISTWARHYLDVSRQRVGATVGATIAFPVQCG
jgi:hypothetical protein